MSWVAGRDVGSEAQAQQIFVYPQRGQSPEQPLMLNLYTNPHEDEEKLASETWILGPMLKIVAAFGESVKKHPLIPMGTPDPYQSRPAQP